MPRARRIEGLPSSISTKLATGVAGHGFLGSLNITSTAATSVAPIGVAAIGLARSPGFAFTLALANVRGIGTVSALGSGRMAAPTGVAATGAVNTFSKGISVPLAKTTAVGAINPLPIRMSVKATGAVSPFILQTVVVLNSGTTFTIPGGVTLLKKVETWGGSGQGGNPWGSPQGGGGGAYAAIVNLTVTPAAVMNMQIGQGGNSTSGTDFGGGQDGTDTWFKDTSTVLAKAGLGGINDLTPNANGGLASGSIGTTKFDGGNGSLAPVGAGAGGGGAAGGPDGAGADGTSGGGFVGNGGQGDNGLGGAGGTGLTGPGPLIGGVGVANPSGGGGGGGCSPSDSGTSTGGAGGAPGGGGGGTNGNGNNGGNGANGQIRITY